MALRADLEPQLRVRRPGLEGLPAGAGDRDLVVLGVNRALHRTNSPGSRCPRCIARTSCREPRIIAAPPTAPQGWDSTPREGGRGYPMLDIESRNSSLFLLFCIRSMSSSIASTG